MKHLPGTRWLSPTLWAIALLLVACPDRAFASSVRVSWISNLRQIALGLQSYEKELGFFPDDLRDPNGKATLSWRVRLLPLVEQQPLFEQFSPLVPWNNPANVPLMDQMPKVYMSPVAGLKQKPFPDADRFAPVAKVRGKNTFFGEHDRRRAADIKGDLSTTIMLVEMDPNFGPVWTEPRDWNFDPADPRQGLARYERNGFLTENGCLAVFGDGSVRFISETIDPELLRALVSANKQQPITWELNWFEASLQTSIGWVIWPAILISLLAIGGSLVIIVRAVRDNVIAPGEMLWIIVGVQQLVYVPAFMIAYRYELVPPAWVKQDHTIFWFLPRLMGCVACLFAMVWYRKAILWMVLFAMIGGLLSLVTLDAARPNQYRYPEESLVTIAAPFVMAFATVATIGWTLRFGYPTAPQHRLGHWIGIVVGSMPLCWFCLWWALGVVAPRELFVRYLV